MLRGVLCKHQNLFNCQEENQENLEERHFLKIRGNLLSPVNLHFSQKDALSRFHARLRLPKSSDKIVSLNVKEFLECEIKQEA